MMLSDRLAAVITGRRTAALVALVPLLLAVLAIGLVGQAERVSRSTDTLPAGLDSTEGAALLDSLPEDDSSTAIVLVSADHALPGATLTLVRTLASDIGAVTTGPGGPLRIAEDGTAALFVVPVEAGPATATAEQVEELRDTLARDLPDDVSGQVTGPAAIQADLAAVFDGADITLLGATAAVVALLLVITYRSPVLWLVPLAVVAVADQLAAVVATQTLGGLGLAWDESTIGILSVLVFGAGTDYALLLISRYRDELTSLESRREAMGRALRRTAEAVLSSSVTVVLGLLTLLLSLVPTTRGLGLACALGVLVAAAFALVVLPASLVCFGRWVFWPRVPHVGDTSIVDGTSLWHRVGARVARRPAAFVTGTLVLLAVLATGLFRIDVGLDRDEQFLDTPESITAAARLGESFPAGTSDPTQVVTRADGDEVLAVVADTPSVLSATMAGQSDGISRIQVILDADPSSAAARTAITDLRDTLDDFPDTHVTGSAAEAVDAEEGTARDRLLIFPLTLLLVLGSLFFLLRSIVAPVLLVATVLATYVASLGLSWWVFTGLLGFSALDAGVPLLAFVFLVALGVDYNIFLVTRAREEAPRHGSREGMLRALTATGGVITSAGILLAAVFAVLGVLPLVVLAQLGTIICIGVLLDTLVVRTVLVPALALVLGDRFWWPRKVCQAEPVISAEEGSARPTASAS